MKKLNSLLIPAVLAVSLLFTLSVSQAALVGNNYGAILSLSPATGTYNINDTFAVSVYLNTNGGSAASAAAYLNYDAAHFQVVSLDTSSPLFTIDFEKTIDNPTVGKIKITRATPSPFVNTTNGLVAVINFKAIAATSPSADNLTFDFTSGGTLDSGIYDTSGNDFIGGVYNAKYTVSGATNPIPISNIPEGGLIRANGTFDVFIVKYVGAKSFKRLILSPSVFNSYQHLKWSDVKDVDQSVVNSFVTSNLVRAVGDSKVYQLFSAGDTGERRWVTTSDVFTRMGLDWDSIYTINQVDRDSYVDGAVLE